MKISFILIAMMDFSLPKIFKQELCLNARAFFRKNAGTWDDEKHRRSVFGISCHRERTHGSAVERMLHGNELMIS